MWKRKLPSGKIQYGEWYLDPMTDQRKRITVTMNSTGRKSDDKIAEEALRTKIKEVYETVNQVDDITLERLFDRYLEYQQTHVKPQTVKGDKHHLTTIVRLLGQDTIASRLTAPYVCDRLDAAAITYNERLRRFKAWIRWAYQMDLVEDIRYLDKIIPKKEDSARVRDAKKYLEHDEIDKLLEGMKEERWRLLTEFLLLSGLRIGEAIAINDADIDDDVIHVTKTYSLTTLQISTTKTATSTRDIDIQPELGFCIRNIRKFVHKDEMMFGYRSDIFFPAFGGGYINYQTYSKYFRENTERLLWRRLTPHALRHTHTAMLAEAGVPLETISRRLGHADSKVTKEVYMHITDGMRQKDRQRLLQVSIMRQ